MRDRTAGRDLLGVLTAVTIVATLGCGSSRITSVRIEAAIERTFANLIHVQLSRLNLPPVAVSKIDVTASCRKLVTGSGASGAGDWTCRIAWQLPNREILRDTYELSVTTDGCYTATVEAADAHLGGPTLKLSDSRDVRNLLYTFEGCFDTT